MATRTLLLRASSLVLLGWAAYRSAAQSEASLWVEIRDAASGQVVPAMVCITSLADHKWRTPPDGSVVPRKNPNFIREYSAGEVDMLRDRIQKARTEYDLLK